MSCSSASAIGGGRREKKYTSNASSTDRTYASPRLAPSLRARSRSVAGSRNVAVSRSTVGVFAIALGTPIVFTISIHFGRKQDPLCASVAIVCSDDAIPSRGNYADLEEGAKEQRRRLKSSRK